MFEVGFTEILLICGIALLVLGPARLPKLAADVGRWAGRARAMARQLRTQLEQELQFDPLADTTRTPAVSTSTSPASAAPDSSRAAPAQVASEPAPPPEVVAAAKASVPAVNADTAVEPTTLPPDDRPRPAQATPDEPSAG